MRFALCQFWTVGWPGTDSSIPFKCVCVCVSAEACSPCITGLALLAEFLKVTFHVL